MKKLLLNIAYKIIIKSAIDKTKSSPLKEKIKDIILRWATKIVVNDHFNKKL